MNGFWDRGLTMVLRDHAAKAQSINDKSQKV